jgi:acetyl-CoA acyltransferase
MSAAAAAVRPLTKRAFVVGGHITKFIGGRHPDFIWKKHPDFGHKENPSLEDYITEAAVGALDATGVPAEAVDKMWIGNFCGELFNNQGHLGAALVGSHPGLYNKPSMRVEGACASGGLAFASALDSIQAGSSDVALVAGAECQTTVSARVGGDYLARASHYSRQRGIDDFTFPALFARRIKACQEELGYTHGDLGLLAAKAYKNANMNPKAHMTAVKMDVETASGTSDANPCFLGNEELSPYLRLSDCSQVSDGGAAMVVVSEEGLAKLGIDQAQCVEVLGMGQATGNLYTDSDPTAMPTTAAAADRAFEQAGVDRADVGVAEVHDCFTVTEMLMMEALGFAGRGEAKEMVRNGDLDIDGRLPCNTGGGLVGFGHPVGATGVKQVLEVYRQMKGQCGDYQMATKPEYGVTANMGGDDKTAVVSVLKNCA